MADHTADPATRHNASAPLATDHLTDPATPGRLLALLAILTRAVAKVRLLEDTGDDRTQRFEAPLPPAADLRLLAHSLMTAAAADEHSNLPKSAPHIHPARTITPDPAVFLDALHVLMCPHHSSEAPYITSEESAISETSGFVRSDPNALAAWLFDQRAEPDTILDLVFHRSSDNWHVEFSPSSELRGESLVELGRNAPPLPLASETPSYDLPRDAYYTAPAAAKQLQVDRSTVTRRVARNKLIGFTIFKRALRIPKDQFLGPDVVPGIPEVLALFAQPKRTSDNKVDHKSAWAFLGGHLFHGDPQPRPIDRLRRAAGQGTTESVLAELARAKESLDRGDHF